MAVQTLTANATSDANGNISFQGAQPVGLAPIPQGKTFTGTLSIPSSPLGGKWTLTVDGTQIATWLGPSGTPVQFIALQTIVIAGSNLTPKTPYIATVNGDLEDGPQKAGQSPQLVSIAAQAPSLPVGAPVSVPASSGGISGHTSFSIATDPSWRSITLLCALANSQFLYATIVGNVTGASYTTGANMIAGGFTVTAVGPFGQFTVPINAAWDTSVTITLYNTDTAGAHSMWVAANTTDTVVGAYGGVQQADIVPATTPVVPVTLLGGPGTGIDNNLVLPVRSDGRNYPLGQHIFGGALATGGVIAAPGVGLHLLLLSIAVAVDQASDFGQLNATINGVNANLLTVWGQGEDSMVWPAGVLCDANTGVGGAITGGATAEAFILYDVVS